jgi:hypothetical protein
VPTARCSHRFQRFNRCFISISPQLSPIFLVDMTFNEPEVHSGPGKSRERCFKMYLQAAEASDGVPRQCASSSALPASEPLGPVASPRSAVIKIYSLDRVTEGRITQDGRTAPTDRLAILWLSRRHSRLSGCDQCEGIEVQPKILEKIITGQLQARSSSELSGLISRR